MGALAAGVSAVLLGLAAFVLCHPMVRYDLGIRVMHLGAVTSIRGEMGRPVPGLAGIRVPEALGRLFGRWTGARGRDRRRQQASAELAEFIDIIALGLQAGLSFDGALGVYVENCHSALSGMMTQAMRSWQLGVSTRRQALEDLADEVDLPEFRSFIHAVNESLEFGAPLASLLVEQSSRVRDERRCRIDGQVQEAPVKMLVPTGVLILPALLLSILGPMVTGMATGVG